MACLVLLYLVTAVTIACAFSGSDADPGSNIIAELVERINRIETLQQVQKEELLAIIEKQAKEIEDLKALCKPNTSTIDETSDKASDNIAADERNEGLSDVEATETASNVNAFDDEVNDTAAVDNNRRAARHGITRTRFLEQSDSVSFSVYLDHDVELGSRQTLKFNQIITNEGGGYNTHTGVFTCPTAGVYMLGFFVGEKDEKGVWAELVVNSNRVVDAAVDTFHPYQDLQGGNMAIIRLARGDAVWVEGLGTPHIEGQEDLRLTTFSGVLLYP